MVYDAAGLLHDEVRQGLTPLHAAVVGNRDVQAALGSARRSAQLLLNLSLHHDCAAPDTFSHWLRPRVARRRQTVLTG